ncbi:hypothetical protein AAZV13_10G190150 [Glycine max]
MSITSLYVCKHPCDKDPLLPWLQYPSIPLLSLPLLNKRRRLRVICLGVASTLVTCSGYHRRRWSRRSARYFFNPSTSATQFLVSYHVDTPSAKLASRRGTHDNARRCVDDGKV